MGAFYLKKNVIFIIGIVGFSHGFVKLKSRCEPPILHGFFYALKYLWGKRWDLWDLWDLKNNHYF